jgi:TonB family protein
MHEGVSDILVARARELDGVARPVTASFAVHVALLATLALLPSAWFANKAPEKVMTISLGSGAEGPQITGMTAMGGKKVDTVVPPTKRPEPIVPVAQKSTAMVEPTKTVPKPPTKPSTAPAAAQTSAVTKPNPGAKITAGNALAATTAQGVGSGLSTGGIGGVQTDADFCCKEYLAEVITAIRKVWLQNQGAAGEVGVEFTIEKNGTLTGINIKKPSGNTLLDMASHRALITTNRVGPLPEQYTGQRLIIVLTFTYQR